MRFAADVHVFPGGAVDAGDGEASLAARSAVGPETAGVRLAGLAEPGLAAAIHVAAVRELFEETGILLAEPSVPAERLAAERRDLLAGRTGFGELVGRLRLRLRTDELHPLSRWVTPRTLARRFDAWFFVAALPAGSEATLAGDEAVEQAWLTPEAALAAMARGERQFWPPTAATLQQVADAGTLAEVRRRYVPAPPRRPRARRIEDAVARVDVFSAGGVPGRAGTSWLVGRREVVVIDPGDPGIDALATIVGAVAARGATIRAIALTDPSPDRAAGLAGLVEELRVPVFAGHGAGGFLAAPVTELASGSVVPAGDVRLEVVGRASGAAGEIVLRLPDAQLDFGRGRIAGRGVDQNAEVPHQTPSQGS